MQHIHSQHTGAQTLAGDVLALLGSGAPAAHHTLTTSHTAQTSGEGARAVAPCTQRRLGGCGSTLCEGIGHGLSPFDPCRLGSRLARLRRWLSCPARALCHASTAACITHLSGSAALRAARTLLCDACVGLSTPFTRLAELRCKGVLSVCRVDRDATGSPPECGLLRLGDSGENTSSTGDAVPGVCCLFHSEQGWRTRHREDGKEMISPATRAHKETTATWTHIRLVEERRSELGRTRAVVGKGLLRLSESLSESLSKPRRPNCTLDDTAGDCCCDGCGTLRLTSVAPSGTLNDGTYRLGLVSAVCTMRGKS